MIKRYEPDADYSDSAEGCWNIGDAVPTMTECESGPYVKWEDYERLRAEVEALRNNYYRLCLWAIDRRPDLPDHSCVECVPNSDLIIHDYRCAYHTAKTWAALAAAGRGE